MHARWRSARRMVAAFDREQLTRRATRASGWARILRTETAGIAAIAALQARGTSVEPPPPAWVVDVLRGEVGSNASFLVQAHAREHALGQFIAIVHRLQRRLGHGHQARESWVAQRDVGMLGSPPSTFSTITLLPCLWPWPVPVKRENDTSGSCQPRQWMREQPVRCIGDRVGLENESFGDGRVRRQQARRRPD